MNNTRMVTTTTFFHPENRDLRWNFIVAARSSFPPDNQLDIVLDITRRETVQRSVLPFIIASMMIHGTSDSNRSLDALISDAKAICSIPWSSDRDNQQNIYALELAEHIVYESSLPVEAESQRAQLLSLLSHEESAISLVEGLEGQYFLVIESTRGLIIGAANPITIIERIWEILIGL